MRKIIALLLSGLIMVIFNHCSEKKSGSAVVSDDSNSSGNSLTQYGGFESQIQWGEHLVTIGLCNDCHTPKKMTSKGLVLDTALWLSGHQAGMPKIHIERNGKEDRNLIYRSALTKEWIGPWGVSYAANLTPDETGIGNWTEEQFFRALREGRFKGLPGARTLLPPMPWDMYKHMTDDEVRAIFAYLGSIKPVSNLVPPSIPSESFIKKDQLR